MIKRFYADDDLLKVPHVALFLLGMSLIIGGIFAGYNAPLGLYSQPMGMDFYCFWSAGRLAIEGRVLDIFDPKVLAVFQQTALGAPDGWSLPWFYPPLLLLFISAGFALLPYKLAYFAYLLFSVATYYFLSRRFFPTLKPLHILSFPAFWFNLLSGQNGLLTAVILIGGLLALTRKPVIAGLILAALSFKPQLCLALPVFLLVERRWQTIFAGTLAFLVLVLAATTAWGPAVWSAFANGLQAAQDFNQLDNKIRPESLAHLYGTLKTIGFDHQPAFIANYMFAALAFAVGLRIFMRTEDQVIKYSVIILATLLLPPHLMYYDFVVTGAVIAWLWPRENLRTALVILWWAPIMWPVVAKFGIPQLPLATALLFYHLHQEAAATAATTLKASSPGAPLPAG
jgi:alpha-1,2-mannosyltransferase